MDGTAAPQALTEGFQTALWAGVVVAVLGLLAAITLVKRDPTQPVEVPAGAALDRA